MIYYRVPKVAASRLPGVRCPTRRTGSPASVQRVRRRLIPGCFPTFDRGTTEADLRSSDHAPGLRHHVAVRVPGRGFGRWQERVCAGRGICTAGAGGSPPRPRPLAADGAPGRRCAAAHDPDRGGVPGGGDPPLRDGQGPIRAGPSGRDRAPSAGDRSSDGVPGLVCSDGCRRRDGRAPASVFRPPARSTPCPWAGGQVGG